MKVHARNLSSGLLALPHPLSATLAGGKGIVVSLSDPEWKAVQSSPQILRLVQSRMLSLAPIDVPAAPAPPAPAPEPVIEQPAPVAEEPKVEEPAAEPAVEQPAPEPAVEEPKAEEPKKKKKK